MRCHPRTAEADAVAMIVNGFFDFFVKELPMEYAIELNRLGQNGDGRRSKGRLPRLQRRNSARTTAAREQLQKRISVELDFSRTILKRQGGSAYIVL